MKTISPIGIESVTYGVEDLIAGARFFEDFGLTAAENGRAGKTFLTKEQTSIHLRLSGDPALPRPIESGPTIREVVWAVRSTADLNAIAGELAKDREVFMGADDTLYSTDP